MTFMQNVNEHKMMCCNGRHGGVIVKLSDL